jgi:hypothetical protein
MRGNLKSVPVAPERPTPGQSSPARPNPAAWHSDLEERYGPPEPARYPGWCAACGGWYERAALTRWHFANGDAKRVHAACAPAGRPR